eukprot:g12496.t1
MVLTNFKSYAGSKVIGPFHKSFSSIVGPNGSGKSNVIDALLFVFGKKASKIRLKKISELIHRSDQHQDLLECRVDVYFQTILDDTEDEEAYSVIPNSELIVSRVATKDNSSRYYLNNKGSNFTEVTDLLKGFGIDLDNNRFLILQGEVEQISLMKPKALNPNQVGVLEYLEDIIGSNKYVAAIEEAYQHVEKLNEERQGMLNRLKMVEKEKDNLKGPKAEAEAYIKQKHQLGLKEAALFQYFAHESEKNVQSVTEKREALTAKLEHERAKLADTTAKLETLEKSYKKQKAEYDAVAAQMEKFKQKFAAFERKDIKAQEDTKHQSSKHKKLQAKVKKLEKTQAELQTQMKEDEQAIPVLQAQVEKLSKQQAVEEEKLAKLFSAVQEKTEPLRQAMEQKQQELVPLQAEVDKRQSAHDVLQSEKTMLLEAKKAQAKQTQDAQKSLAQVEAQLKQLSAQVKERESKLSSSTKKLAVLQEKLERAIQEEAEVTQRRQELLGKVEEAKQGLSSANSQNALVKALMEQKQAGRFPGILGRLGDLGAIEAKYDVAVSTACPALNNIVVDSSRTAQQCVAFLRTRQLGRATFIIVDKMQQYAASMNRPLDAPENAPRLFDLIKVPDAALRPCFYYATKGNTLVANDLDQAVRLAYSGNKRFRVVTLAGQVIDTSGTMSGGGSKPLSGLMGTKAKGSAAGGAASSDFSDRQVKEMEKELTALDGKLAKVRDAKRALEKEVSENTKEVQALEVGAKKLAVEVRSAQTQKQELQERVAELEKGSQRGEGEEEEERARLTQLDKELATADKALKAAEQKTEALKKDVEKINQRMLDAGGAELRDQKAKLQSVLDKSEAADKQITKLTVGLEAGAKKLKKAAKEQQTATKEMEECTARLEELKAESKELEDAALKTMQKYKAAQEELDSNNTTLTALQKEFEEMKKVVGTVREVEMDIQDGLAECDKVLSENSKKAKHWTGKLKALVQNLEATVQSARDDAEAERALLGASAAPRRPDVAVVDPAAPATAGQDGSAPMEVEEGRPEQKAERTDQQEAEGKKTGKEEKQAEKEEAEEDGLLQLEEYKELAEQQLAALNKDDLQYEVTMLETALAQMKPNMPAIKEYRPKLAD